MNFNRLELLTTNLKQTNSITQKKYILKQFEDMKEILEWTYNPYKKYHVTARNIKKFMSNKADGVYVVNSIFELLSLLTNREVTGHDALSACSYFIDLNKKHEEIILKILNKDLECGTSIKTINSTFPGLIPLFEVPLASLYKPDKHSIFDGQWFLSRKLDGIRCLIFIEEDSIKCMTREGHEITTLEKIKEELLNRWDYLYPIILDGELCIYRQGQEYFNEISSLWNRKNYTIENPMFYVFDIYSIEEFKQGYSDENYAVKIPILASIFKGYKYIRFLEQLHIKKEVGLDIPEGWEGLIVRKMEETIFKRSNNLLKIKEFKEEEFKIISLKESTMMIDGKKVPVVGSFDIDYKGFTVNVGSGLSQEQRIDWLKNPNEVLNKTVTIRYTAESQDKQGNLSLRFPRFKNFYTQYEEEDMF